MSTGGWCGWVFYPSGFRRRTLPGCAGWGVSGDQGSPLTQVCLGPRALASASPACEPSEAPHLRPRTEAAAINLLLHRRARLTSFPPCSRIALMY